jgi:cytochrome c oxidase assembly factor CtaG
VPAAATSYPGPPPLSWGNAWAQWRIDLPVLAVVLAAGVAYLLAVARVRRGGLSWGWPRAAAFLAGGLGSIVIATMSVFGVYDRTLFWPNAVQNMLLLSLCPVLLGFGRPLRLAAQSLPEPVTRRVRTSPVARVLTHPLVSTLLGPVVLFSLYLTPYYAATLRSVALHELLRAELLVAGCLFFWPMLGDGALPAWCTHPVRVGLGLLDGLIDALPGLVVMLTGHLIAGGYYRFLGRTWGPSLHWDQTIGGGLMLTIAELVSLPFLGGQLLAWARADAAEAADTDKALDELASAQASAGGADAGPAGRTRPWWETDPRFTERFKPVQ